MKSSKGITLVALVITIIVMLILTGVSLNATIGENGILTQGRRATISQRFATYKEQLEFNLKEDMTCTGANMRAYIPALADDDLEKFVISNGKLAYIGETEWEKEIAVTLQIATELSENTEVQDVITIIDKILPTNNAVEVPKNDAEVTPVGLAGKRLYDKTAQNLEKWNLVIDYDSNNNERARYGSGYYLLTPGTYEINGETVTIQKNYVVNYATNDLIGLSDRYVEWSLESSLAVSDGLVLNVDPTNLAAGEWTGIKKHGDVVYNSATKALVFNESADNIKGERRISRINKK